MFQKRAWECLVGLGLLVTGLGMGLGQQETRPPASTSIRFVDLNLVLDAMNGKGQRIQEIEQTIAQLRDRFEKQEKALDLLRADLQASTPGSKEYLDLKDQFEQEEIRLRQIRDRSQMTLSKMEANALVDSYKDIRQAIEDYRDQNEIAGVFIIDKGPLPLDFTDRIQVGQFVNLRPVVAWDPALDITQAIIKMLN